MSVRILLTDEQWADIVSAMCAAESVLRTHGARVTCQDITWARETLEQEAITPTDEKAGR